MAPTRITDWVTEGDKCRVTTEQTSSTDEDHKMRLKASMWTLSYDC